jgi:hypothetical protein
VHNPYFNTGPNLQNAATRLIAISQDDVNNLSQVCKGLRIYNSGAAATIRITTAGGDDVTLNIPAATLWIEEVVVSKVWDTGTTDGLVIHGYTD